VALAWFLLLIGVLVAVHEAGHLVAARLCGVAVLRISIGFGRPLVSFWWRGTEYALGRWPLGGYVRLLGEGAREAVPEALRARAFCTRPAWQRLAIVLAGPAANLLFAVLLLSQLYAREERVPSSTLGAVFAGQPAADADLRTGDRVIAIDDEPIETWEQLNRRVLEAPGRGLRVTVARAGVERPLTKYVRPREHLRTDGLGARQRIGLIGVASGRRLPQVGVLSASSPAARAGLRTFDVVLAIQGRQVATTADLAPLVHPESGGMLVVSYLRPVDGSAPFAALARLSPRTAQVVPTAVERVGRPPRFETGALPADLFVQRVEPGSPAARLGLRAGDLVTTLDGAQAASWELFAQTLEERPTERHQLGWRSALDEVGAGERRAFFELAPRTRLDEYQAETTFYVFGAEGSAAVAPGPEVVVARSLPAAVGRALEHAAIAGVTTTRAIVRIAFGRLPATAIGGPILLYQIAGVAGHKGWDHFLAVTALVSINLGLVNLLPLPLLDGGQAAVMVLERIRRRPVSGRASERAALFGLVLLVVLVLLAARNDLTRLLGR
jgi:regulator of sigma E protease